MATKKPAPKKKAPVKARAKASIRQAPAAPAAAVAAAPRAGASPLSKALVGAVILIALGIVAVIAKQRHQGPVAPAAVAPAVSPAPTAVAQPALPPIQAEGPKLTQAKAPAHREAASAPMSPAMAEKPNAEAKAKPEADAAPAPASSAADDDQGRRVSAAHPLKLRAWRKDGATATVDLFGAHNKVLAHLESEAGPAGWETLAWDGLDPQGQAAPAGVVYVRASAPGLQDIERVRIR